MRASPRRKTSAAAALAAAALAAAVEASPGLSGGRPRGVPVLEPPAAEGAVRAPPPQTVELSLPFEGPWGIVQGFDSGHTHVGYAAFALDFVPAERAPKGGQRHRSRLRDYPCFGRPVLAPADGTVAWARDGARDPSPGSRHGYDPGNFVILEHAEAEYTELRHLQRGSVRVAVGDSVRRGEPIGRCGNSGNATLPHLHVGLLASANPIATRPMRFSRYEVLGEDGSWRPGDGLLEVGQIVRPARPDAGVDATEASP